MANRQTRGATKGNGKMWRMSAKDIAAMSDEQFQELVKSQKQLAAETVERSKQKRKETQAAYNKKLKRLSPRIVHRLKGEKLSLDGKKFAAPTENDVISARRVIKFALSSIHILHAVDSLFSKLDEASAAQIILEISATIGSIGGHENEPS